MPNAMKAIQERLTHLEGLMSRIPEDKDYSFHDRLELVMDIAKKVYGQYIELATEIGRKWYAIDEELFVLRRQLQTILRVLDPPNQRF